jgi:hypothetical protein
VKDVARVGELRRRRDRVHRAVGARRGAGDDVGLVAEVEREVAVRVDVRRHRRVEDVQRLLARLVEVFGLGLDLVLGARGRRHEQQYEGEPAHQLQPQPPPAAP